jgi:hypothetical protein
VDENAISPANNGGFRLPKNGTLVTLVIAGINFLLVFANLYLSNGYVSKLSYESDQRDNMQHREQLNTELKNIAVELRGIVDHNEIDVQQEQRLADIEQRLRELEKKH